MAIQARPVTLIVGFASMLVLAPVVQAAGFGDMFNPGRWFGGKKDDYYYDDGPYGGPYGGYGPYGAPYGGGYGAPYGAPGYGYPAAPGYAAPGYAAPGYAAPMAPSTPSAPADTGAAKDAEIEALKRRIEQLEGRQSGPAAPAAGGGDAWPSAPAFRPMDQY